MALTFATACSTALRDPYERAVSGWFYRGHHPGSDFFRVGWPPVHGFLDGGASTEISFENYLRTRAYANVFTRMLGMNGRAYDGAAVPDLCGNQPTEATSRRWRGAPAG